MARSLPTVAPGPSLYQFVCAHLDADGRLSDDAAVLPDAAEPDDDDLRWAPGAMDGVLGRHGGGDDSRDRADEVARLIGAASNKPSKRNLRKLYAAVAPDDALSMVDLVIERLPATHATIDGVRRTGWWLATTASDRGAVKVGLALLGVTGPEHHAEVVLALGAHDEFTLFAAVALANGLDDAEPALWALAQRVDGWGRIHCVERLRATNDPAIQDWILRGGFRNAVMNEYLAYTAATTGRLVEQLRASPRDRELLTAAGDILEALVSGGPAEDIDDWDDAAEGVEAYLVAIGPRAEGLHDFLVVAELRAFLSRSDGWDERAHRGWTTSRRSAFEAACDEILGRERWRDVAATGLLSDDDPEFWMAQQVAEKLGIDTFDALVARIGDDPYGGMWFQAWNLADRARAEQLVQLVRTVLPVHELGSGATMSLGLGPDAKLPMAMDWTLQALRDHEGVGADLVVLGLQSPVVRNRNMSLDALKDWSRAAWPPDAEDALRRVAATDPSDRVREYAQQVLDGTAD